MSAEYLSNSDLSYEPVKFLTDHYLNRKEKNPSYSLRAFARDIGISVTQLSRALNRERDISVYDRVYHLGCQFFPVSSGPEKRKQK